MEVYIKIMNGLVMTLEEEKRFFMCLAALLCEQFYRFANCDWRCQDIDQILLHEIFFFFLSVFSSSEVLGKNASIRSKLPTAASWSNLLDVEGDFGTTNKSFTVFFACEGVKFDR